MSSTRKIEEKTLHVEVKPYNTLFVGPMPCEKKAAAILNKTSLSMQQNDIGDVAYRYLQCRRGKNNTLKEAILWGSYSIILLGFMRRKPRQMGLIWALPTALHVPPNIGNTIRYAETQKSCEEWLATRLDKDKVAEIRAMTFTQSGMFSLTHFLNREKIDNTSVIPRTKTEDSHFSCLNMDR